MYLYARMCGSKRPMLHTSLDYSLLFFKAVSGAGAHELAGQQTPGTLLSQSPQSQDCM